MARTELPTELQTSLGEALALLTERAPSQLRSLLAFRRALAAGSPILRQRYLHLVEDALASPEGEGLSGAERRMLGTVATELEEHLAGRRGPKPRRENSYRLMVYLSHEERERLERLQAQLDLPASDVVRRGLQALEATQ